MGARKRVKAEELKSEKKHSAVAKLNNSTISPRKMRMVADLIRGVEVNTYDVLNARKVLVTQTAVSRIEEILN